MASCQDDNVIPPDSAEPKQDVIALLSLNTTHGCNLIRSSNNVFSGVRRRNY